MKQANALSVMQMGHNVFLTGQAGSGKTYTLNNFIHWTREHQINTAVTASTGIAATHIAGTTIHSWSGIGIKDELSKKDLRDLAKKKDLQKRFSTTKILIIDEVSMISATMFDNLNLVCKHMLENDLPFGGLQIVLCGDLFQLPPISRSRDELNLIVHSEAWSELKPVICYLKEQHRQNLDDPLTKILNSIREGGVGKSDIEELNKKVVQNAEVSEELIELPSTIKRTTKLYSHNVDVDQINIQELAKIVDQSSKIYVAERMGNRALVNSLIKSCLAPEELELKIGAEVMFVKNDTSGRYVNGTRGRIVNFTKKEKYDNNYPIVETLEGKIIVAEPDSWAVNDEKGGALASITQIPLRLAWAITIHKSQGMSLDSAQINLSRVFEYGMGYVALSRVRTLEGLTLEGFNDMSLQINPKVIRINKQLSDHSDKAAERLEQLDKSKIKSAINKSIIELGGDVVAKKLNDNEVSKLAKVPGEGSKGRKGSHKTSIPMLLEGKTIAEVAKIREVKPQTIIGHLARHIEETEPGLKRTELAKFKKLKPPAKQINLLKKILKDNKGIDPSSRYAQPQILKKLPSGQKMSYEEIALALIWT